MWNVDRAAIVIPVSMLGSEGVIKWHVYFETRDGIVALSINLLRKIYVVSCHVIRLVANNNLRIDDMIFCNKIPFAICVR